MVAPLNKSIKRAIGFILVMAIVLCIMPTSNDVNAQENQNVTFPGLAGKKVSILGDSLTSFKGTASNGTQSTSHTTRFQSYVGTYPNERSGITSINQMFYGKFIEENNMELYVNNSIGGTGVTINYTSSLDQNITFLGGTESQNRILGLWDYDTSNNRVDPDIILVSGSGNDFDLAPLGEWDGDIAALNATSHPTTFKMAYAVLLKRLTAEYPNADIWCITLQSFSDILSDPTTQFPDKNLFGDTLLTYNQGIRDVANAFDAYVLDLEIAVTPEQYNTHKYDNIHPNLLGHQAMYEQMVKDFSKIYETNSNAVISSLEITKAPDKTEYIKGEHFNSEGMIVRAIYSNNTTNENFTDYSVIDANDLTLEDTFVTIMANNSNISITQAITVKKPPIAGDINNDRIINATDIMIIISDGTYNSSVPTGHVADINKDNKVNFIDIAIMRNSANFGKTQIL